MDSIALVWALLLGFLVPATVVLICCVCLPREKIKSKIEIRKMNNGNVSPVTRKENGIIYISILLIRVAFLEKKLTKRFSKKDRVYL
jgi:hypothetical protein